eukprot:Clim_evm47s147 gene=Clim_evmTU47s147
MIICSLLLSAASSILGLYFTTENWAWHKNSAAEERFWGLWAAYIAAVLLLGPDSPFVGYLPWYVDIIIIFASFVTIRATIRGREVRRLRTQVYAVTFGRPIREDEQELVDEMNACLRRLHFNLAATTVKAIYNKSILEAEETILGLVENTDLEYLEYALLHISLPELIHCMRDHQRLSKEPNKTRLLDLFFFKRINEFSVVVRAALISALMRTDNLIQTHPKGHAYVASALLSLQGNDLVLFKALIDSTGDYYTMHKLLYIDLPEGPTRKKILQHFKVEAVRHRHKNNHHRTSGNQKLMRGVTGMLDTIHFNHINVRKATTNFTKILSDIDDTLYSSGGDGWAGIDNMFPRRVLYPGVLAFYRALDLGPRASDFHWPKHQIGNLCFLSARPHIYKDVTEAASYSLFARLIKDRHLHAMPTLLAGDLESRKGVRIAENYLWLELKEYTPIENKKMQNFMEYAACFPEYDFILVGDNGQADVQVAKRAMKSLDGKIKGALMHVIQPIKATFGYEEGDEERLPRHGIHYFHTFVEAAEIAYGQGWISEYSLGMVMRNAKVDLLRYLQELPLTKEERKQKPGKLPIFTQKQRLFEVRAINKALERVNEIVDKDFRLPLVGDDKLGFVPTVEEEKEAQRSRRYADADDEAFCTTIRPGIHHPYGDLQSAATGYDNSDVIYNTVDRQTPTMDRLRTRDAL